MLIREVPGFPFSVTDGSSTLTVVGRIGGDRGCFFLFRTSRGGMEGGMESMEVDFHTLTPLQEAAVHLVNDRVKNWVQLSDPTGMFGCDGGFGTIEIPVLS